MAFFISRKHDIQIVGGVKGEGGHPRQADSGSGRLRYLQRLDSRHNPAHTSDCNFCGHLGYLFQVIWLKIGYLVIYFRLLVKNQLYG